MPNIHTMKAKGFEYPETLPKDYGFPQPPRVPVAGWRPAGKVSPTTQQPRPRKKKGGRAAGAAATAAADAEPDLTTRPDEQHLPFVEQRVSTAEFGKARLEGGRFVDWNTQRATATVLLKLKTKAVLSRLVIRNRGVSRISVRLGLTSKKGGWID